MEPNPSGPGQQSQRQAPVYDPNVGGHYGLFALINERSPSSGSMSPRRRCHKANELSQIGASAALSAQGFAPVAELYQGAWANVNQGLHGNYRDILTTYWQQTINHLETETHDYKIHQLPLARIKKVMKADPDVKMISAEAPILFAKGCDIFITELTMRAWIHAEENKRRTLQRSDIASALAKSDMFDFLIDIVPREEAAGHPKRTAHGGASSSAAAAAASSGTQIIPPQSNVQQQQPPSHPQQQQPGHQIQPPEYPSLGNNPMPQEPEYRQPAIYTPQVPPDAANSYGQQQQSLFDGVYGYAPMAPQIYVSQRGQEPPAGQEQSHHYQRHDDGGNDADAEGDRDYEVA